MKVKRYLVNDMNEAMVMIKNELGKDAIILSSRKIKPSGFFGLFGKSKFEVMAAVEDQVQVNTAEKQIKSSERDKSVLETYIKVKEQTSENEKNTEISHFNKDLYELREMVNLLVSQKSDSLTDVEIPSTDNFDNSLKNIQESTHRNIELNPKINSPVEQVKQWLMERDVEGSHADKITDILFFGGETPEDVSQSLRQVIQKLLGNPYTIEKTSSKPKVCLFVGPTGVGKTTTLAKLAAKLSLIENKKIGLITSDTYRIAAVDQLKTYSEILGIPLTVIYDADELPMTLDKYMDRDYILIDTAGRSQNSREFESDVATLLEYVDDPEIFLVISLTTGYKEIRKILDAYSFLTDYKLLFTKLDESSSLGNVLNARMLTNKSLSYFTIGQSVPDDIEVANPDKIINYIVGE